MKLKTLVKLNALKQSPARIEVNYSDDTGHIRSIDLEKLEDYLCWKDRTIIDWHYYPAAEGSEEQDFIIVEIAGAC